MLKFNPGGIRIEGTDDLPNYETDVEKELNKILNNPVGAVVLNIIDMDPKFIHIIPNTNGVCSSASASPVKPRDASPKNVTPYAGYADGEIV